MKNLETFEIEQKDKKKKNKIEREKGPKFKPLMIIIILSLVGFGVYFINANTDYLKPIIEVFTKEPEEIVEVIEAKPILNEVIYELGSTLDDNIESYIKNYEEVVGSTIDLSGIPQDLEKHLDTIGEYDYKVVFEEEEFIGKVIVKDTTPPVVVVKTAYVPQGKKIITPELFIRSISDISNQYVSEITNLNEINTNIQGEKKVNLLVKDTSGNETKIESKLVVLDLNYSEIYKMQDLNVSYNDQNDLNWENTITEKFESALTTDSEIYKSALNKINTYNWQNKINTLYPNATINAQEVLTLYNQGDLVVGLTKRVNLTYNSTTKDYYLSY